LLYITFDKFARKKGIIHDMFLEASRWLKMPVAALFYADFFALMA
jgi:hypothetical protein